MIFVKRNEWTELIQLLLSPVLLAVLGIILIVNPDGAVALVTKVIAWVLVIAALGLVIGNLTGPGSRRAGSLVAAAICLVLGLWLISNPLALAAGPGRIIGIVLILEGAGDLLAMGSGRGSRSAKRGGAILSLVTLVAGVILVVVPMTFSQLLITVCGIVLLVLGVVGIVSRLRMHRFLTDGDDPDIIDGEKL